MPVGFRPGNFARYVDYLNSGSCSIAFYSDGTVKVGYSSPVVVGDEVTVNVSYYAEG